MPKHQTRKTIVWLLAFLIIEAWSLLSLSFTLVNQLFLSLLIIVALGLSFYKLEYGILLVLAELFIGSLGHLFVFSIFGWSIPLRFVLFGATLLVFVIQLARQLIVSGLKSDYYQRTKGFLYWKYLGLLFVLILVGLINGWSHGHPLSTILVDFNAWLYFLLVFPLIVVYNRPNETALNNLKILFLAAAIWLSLKTLFLLFVFTHNLSFAPDLYLWLRRTLVGEMTATTTGWPRIFIQGQIFPLIAFGFLMWFQAAAFRFQKFLARANLKILFLAALFLSVFLISFSRSFWVGLIVALIVSLILMGLRYSKTKPLVIGAWILSALIGAFLLIYVIAIFPYPQPGKFNADFLDRLSNNNEAALASRWSLLPVLERAISQNPWLGQGYGATITYLSRDPRVLANNPTGQYTTYAFEWGYLDLWLKLGSLGLIAYLWWLAKLLSDSFRPGAGQNNYLIWGLGTGIIFLAITNIFTPYLNHPLGIGYFLLASCLIRQDRVY